MTCECPLLHFFIIFLIMTVACCKPICPAGQFLAQYDICRNCPPDTFQDTRGNIGISSCKPCPADKVSTEWGGTECVSCPENSKVYKNRYGTGCKCFVGTVEKPDGQCVFCNPGEKAFQPENDIGCESCGDDIEKEPRLTRCIKCPKGQVIVNNDGECGLCPPGWEFWPGVNRHRGYECSYCRRGYFKATHGQSSCEKCPAGSYRQSATTGCIFCPNGTAYDGGEEKCMKCPPGHFYDPLYPGCIECRLNTFQPKAGVSRKCLKCPKGSWALSGASKCVECGDHEFLNEAGECDTCPPGEEPYALDRDPLTCQECEQGFFQPFNGARKCRKCPKGLFSLYGASKCVRCPKGKVLMSNGKCQSCPPGFGYGSFISDCEICYDGTFKSTWGLQPCRKCPKWSYTLKEGASNCIKCAKGEALNYRGTCETCPPGKFMGWDEKIGGLTCQRCYFRRFKPVWGVQDCVRCPEGMNVSKGHTKCT